MDKDEVTRGIIFNIQTYSNHDSPGIRTALDTCGYTKWEIMKEILCHVDLVLYDVKHMGPVAHQLYTDVSNDVILENARRICQEFYTPVLARIPVIRCFNDSMENIEATEMFIATEPGTSTEVQLLPHHGLGEMKYHSLEKQGHPVSISSPGDQYILRFKEVFKSFGL